MSIEPATRPVTQVIARLADDVPGWTPPDQLLALYMLAAATCHLEGDILEIGSWCGRSAAVLGHAALNTGGHVHAIDLFPSRDDWRENADGTHSYIVKLDDVSIAGYEHQTIWDEPFRREFLKVHARFESVMDAFTHTMTAEGLSATVSPFRGTSGMFAKAAPDGLRLRLAFIDGEHSYSAVCKDIEVVEQFLVPGGWIAFDDAFSVYGGVDKAIRDRIVGSRRYAPIQHVARKLVIAQRVFDL